MLTSNARYILKNDDQKLKMRDMQKEIWANRDAIYALEDGLSPIEGRLAAALRASNDEASGLRGRLTDMAASRQGHIDLERLSAQQPGACQSCVQLLRRIQRFERNVMTDREASDLDRERNWGARYKEGVHRVFGHARRLLETERHVTDLQRQLAQAKACTSYLPPDSAATHDGAEITSALGPEVGRTDAPARVDTPETSAKDATGGDWPNETSES